MSACDGCRHHELTEPTAFCLTHFCRLRRCWPFELPEECEWRDFDVMAHRVCGSCRRFLGGGDWGLSCKAHYHRLPEATTDASDCDEYEKVGLNANGS